MLRPPRQGDIRPLVAQISARQKARDKLPAWYENDDLIFPPTVSVEQASSEQTARYKASLVAGDTLLDLTGGMGVDTWAFAQRMKQVVYVEHRAELAALAAHNLPKLGLTNVRVLNEDGLAFLQNFDGRADWVYLDPARRDEQGGRVVRLEDCVPNVLAAGVLSGVLARAEHLLLKTSPLLDLEATIRGLGRVKAVHVVALQGEVKEILFVVGQAPVALENVQVNAVNLTINKAVIQSFLLGEERSAEVVFDDPGRYIYEPNAAVLKAGAFRLIAQRFELAKLAPHSHLYTSPELKADFPGRVFDLVATCKPDRKALRSLLPDLQANLTVRNFPQSVDALRKQLGLREGGNVYILATTLRTGEKRLLITQKTGAGR
ncbi:SAM-dependent methyltransferase [Fibrisoma montanum]|uniref:SAM-dependent methyltransferase n=2 Tax=Fibrisoma montanum TaxID=2305895 RepID=A0A418MCJ2_9BACT|nr:SAM-dependent methyltransferase [Fibrisoma montanum]